MKILIDIVHIADVNFYKYIIQDLKNKGHHVIITVRPRGKLVDVLKKEYQMPIHIIGKHYKGKIGKIWGMLKRNIQLYFFLRKTKPDVVTGFGSFYIAMAAKPLKIKSVIFYDDVEYKTVYKLSQKYATKFIIPNSINDKTKNTINGFDYKESIYLNKKNFHPNIKSLKKYNLKAEKYVFIREITTISLNYKGLKTKLDEIIPLIKNKNLKIILSLEDKTLSNKYSKECIILKEPVEDIYSLMYYSKYVISSGDTVARESAIIGIPTLYTGEREMKINQKLNIDTDINKFFKKNKNKNTRLFTNNNNFIELLTK